MVRVAVTGIDQSMERRNSPLDWLGTILSTSVAERHTDAKVAAGRITLGLVSGKQR